jgi:two-component system, OmpR family, response regulator
MQIRKVLIVDDDPHIRRIGELSLQNVGKFEVILAKSGPEAVELAQSAKPDVILLDVMMPGVDGPTTFSRLRQNPETKDICVIFMTAKVQKQEVSTYLDLGAAGVIGKPFNPISLCEEVKKIANGQAQIVCV